MKKKPFAFTTNSRYTHAITVEVVGKQLRLSIFNVNNRQQKMTLTVRREDRAAVRAAVVAQVEELLKASEKI
jgi:tRNA threonylcarbamoyladenosine modification (KEOPS) complex  Pcc1 subunit